MNLHSKARTCPASRELIAKRMLDGAWSEDQAATFGISARTAFKWLARYRAEGDAGLEDRSSRPHHSPRQTSAASGEAQQQVMAELLAKLVAQRGTMQGRMMKMQPMMMQHMMQHMKSGDMSGCPMMQAMHTDTGAEASAADDEGHSQHH